MKKPDFSAVSNELKIKTLRDIAMGEARSLPPAIFDEFREAINSCDTEEELQLIRLNIMKVGL